jgi:hypothetical protein
MPTNIRNRTLRDRCLADDLLRARVRRNRVIETLLEKAGPELLASVESERDIIGAWRAFERLSPAHAREIEAGIEDGPVQHQYNQAEAMLLGPSDTLAAALVRLLYGLRECIRERLDGSGGIDVDSADYWDLVTWEALADLIKFGGIERLTKDVSKDLLKT